MEIYSGAFKFKTTLESEYGIVAHFSNNFIDANFTKIFKDGQVTETNFVEENLMVDILRRKSVANVTEGFVMQVALNYVRYLEHGGEGDSEKWKEAARRIIPKTIDFTKLSMKELDLTGTYKILPEDVKVAIINEIIEKNKNGLVGSAQRSGSSFVTNSILMYKNAKATFTRNKSTVKVIVNQDALFQFKRSGQPHQPNSYKKITWKPVGGISENYEGGAIDTARMYAPANTKITLEVEMTGKSPQYCFENLASDKKVVPNNQGFELEVLEVNDKPTEEAITYNEGVHFYMISVCPIKN